MRVVSAANLGNYVGQNISQICTTGLTSPTHNHCAHFVSHVEGFQFGLLCGDMGSSSSMAHQGATIRVNELYNSLQYRGPWAEKPVPLIYCLIFVTSADNFHGNQMGQHPHKHVGIWSDPFVYEYSNQAGHVLRDNSPEDFFNRLRTHYHEPNVSLYYGYTP